MKKKLLKKSTVDKVQREPLLNAAISMTAIDGDVRCEMCGSRLSLLTSITTLVSAFSKRSNMPLKDVLEIIDYNINQKIAEQDAEAPFGKEFEECGVKNEKQQTIFN